MSFGLFFLYFILSHIIVEAGLMAVKFIATRVLVRVIKSKISKGEIRVVRSLPDDIPGGDDTRWN